MKSLHGIPSKVIAAGLIALVAGLITYGISNNNSGKNPGGQSGVSAGNSGQANVAATFYPLYEFARAVGGDKVAVASMTPAGTEPHDYEPTPKELITASNADLFIYLGNSFEPWADKFLEEYPVRRVQAISGLEPQPDAEDPHVWLDPVYAQAIVTRIAQGLADADPSNRSYFMDNAARYVASLQQLDESYRSGLATCQTRAVITAHDAFGYVAKRYNLEVVPIAGLSPEDEPDAARLAELTRLAKEKGITTVFFESLVNPRLAETLAKEAGTKTAVLDPIEGISNEDQAQGKDYIAVQRENLQALRAALACQ